MLQSRRIEILILKQNCVIKKKWTKKLNYFKIDIQIQKSDFKKSTSFGKNSIRSFKAASIRLRTVAKIKKKLN